MASVMQQLFKEARESRREKPAVVVEEPVESLLSYADRLNAMWAARLASLDALQPLTIHRPVRFCEVTPLDEDEIRTTLDAKSRILRHLLDRISLEQSGLATQKGVDDE